MKLLIRSLGRGEFYVIVSKYATVSDLLFKIQEVTGHEFTNVLMYHQKNKSSRLIDETYDHRLKHYSIKEGGIIDLIYSTI